MRKARSNKRQHKETKVIKKVDEQEADIHEIEITTKEENCKEKQRNTKQKRTVTCGDATEIPQQDPKTPERQRATRN